MQRRKTHLKTPDIHAVAACLLAAFLLFFAGCGGGGSAPEVAQNPGSGKLSNPGALRLAGSGAVYIRLVEAGDDLEVTGKLITPLVTKSLQDSGVKVADSDAKSDLVIHGVVKLRLKERNQRLGVDKCTYATHAAFRLLHTGGYQEISVHEVTAEGTGIGRKEAITNTMKELSGKIAAEIAPGIKQLTASK